MAPPDSARSSSSVVVQKRANDKFRSVVAELGKRRPKSNLLHDPVQAVLNRSWETPRRSFSHTSPARRSSFSSPPTGHGRQHWRRHSWSGPQTTVPAAANMTGQLDFLSKRSQRRYIHCIAAADQEDCPEPFLYRPAAGCRRGPSSFACLGWPEDGETTDNALEKQFCEVSMKFNMILHQACIVMNDIMASIRERHLQDNSSLAAKQNIEVLADIAYAVSTSSYFFSKWCHELEPETQTCLLKPSKPLDSSASELLSYIHSAVSRMEVHGSKLAGMLKPILKIAKLPQHADGPTSSARDIARMRGLSTEEFSGIAMHLEHLLSITRRFARSLSSTVVRPHTAPSSAGSARVAAKHKLAVSGASSMVSTAVGSTATSRCASPAPSERALLARDGS